MLVVLLISMWVAVGLLNLAAVLAVRRLVARALRIEGVHWLPWRTLSGDPPLAWWKPWTFALAGAMACYALAASIFVVTVKVDGRAPGPGAASTTIDVVAGLPAAEAGVKDGDRILEVAGTPIAVWTDLPAAVRAHAGERVELWVERAGERQRIEVEISPQGQLGVAARLEPQPVGMAEALLYGATRPAAVLAGLARGLYLWLAGNVEEELGGPVMIVQEANRPSVGPSWIAMFGIQDTYFGLPFGVVLAFVTRVRRTPKLRGKEPSEP